MFNWTIMQFLLTGFRSCLQGVEIIILFDYFLPDGAVFSGLAKTLALFLFSAYYRADWINNAAILL